MKSIFLSLAFFLLVNYAQATIRRCNNNPNVIGTYTTAQAAHDAANPGDTIHLEPSTNSDYGDLTISKQITLIGTGDYLNDHPGNQVNFYPVGYCSSILILEGSDSSVINAKVTGTITIRSNNITISNTTCGGGISFGSTSNGPLNGIAIAKSDIAAITEESGGGANNAVIRNNRIFNIHLGNASTVILSYNTILMYFGGSSLFNSIVANNIFIHSNNYQLYAIPSFTYCNLFNNIAEGEWLPNSNGNLNNVDPSIVFSSIQYGSSYGGWYFFADNCQLSSSYPNQNLGMFAGPDPYRLALIPPVPSIYELTVPSSNTGNILNITVSTKSNN